MTCPDSAPNLIQISQHQAPFPEANVGDFALTQNFIQEVTDSGAAVMAAVRTWSAA